MIEVYPNLFVGNQLDFENNIKFRMEEWAVVHACKEPYHRSELRYTGRGAPKYHPEYFLARRDNRLMMNIVDADNPNFFSKEDMIDPTLDFIDEAMSKKLKVLIHCNQGESRAPCLALLYMASRLNTLPNKSFESAESEFKKIYNNYYPKSGIREHIRQNWDKYLSL